MTDKPKKKRKKPLTKTPVARITSALRLIWTYSPEKREIMKRANGHCEECGEPGAKTKKEQEKKGGKRLEVHHLEPCDLTKLAKKIHAVMFPGPGKLTALCQECHLEADEILRREKS